MCDVGAIGLSKDTGPSGGFGLIVNSSARGWKIGRTSQEHGLMVADNTSGLNAPTPVDLGQMVHIIPQHACLTAAQYPWYYVVEKGGEEVVDVWVPWKFW
jgi:D-serine deaminase-like pyridoxal phosphate-dependent protein